MLKKSFFTFVTILFLLVTAFKMQSSDPQKFENFTLKDYNGKEHSLSDFSKSKAIVVMFIATKCPVSNDYNSRMAEVYKEYKDKNISFVGINSNKKEPVDEMRSHAKENKLEFIILKDKDNIIADKFKASVTPEIYVLDKEFNLLYHGRIDDNQRAEKISKHDLKNVLDEILSGKKVSTTKTKAFGCSIKRI